MEDNTLFYGEIPHRRAVEIADYEFFWDNLNELAPFGSEEGYIAFTELAQWMRNNPRTPMIEYIKWVLECWDINFEDFDDSIIEPESICKIINDLLPVCADIYHCILWLIFSRIHFIGNINVKFLLTGADKKLHQVP